MNRLINAHIQFLKYNYSVLKQKLPLNKRIIFLLRQLKTYGKFLIQLYKGLFIALDPQYQKQKAEAKKQQEVRKQIIGMVKLLRYSKDKMRKMGMSRQSIRRFFITVGGDDKVLEQLCNELMKEIGG